MDHTYLWRTMEKMDFHPQFIQLVKGLVSTGSSKVHLQGLFTKSFKLMHGVYQGCSLSPILFALSMQPLMLMLRREEQLGRLEGVNIPGGCPPPSPFLCGRQWGDTGLPIFEHRTSEGGLCWNFLLGMSREGKGKVVLVAWKIITQPEALGGLGITPFRDLFQSLKLKYIGRLIDGSKAEWACAARFFIKSEL
ncbi:hypothetical protein R1flu_027718 [Riccia fluitans]|uniref:Reverse transcriptase domain-containing protein n=1 Tax=Riccia fluitans TaxID=41844 RepID=A0ABD1XK37_9MARC